MGATNKLLRNVCEPIRIDIREIFSGSAILYLNPAALDSRATAFGGKISPGRVSDRRRGTILVQQG